MSGPRVELKLSVLAMAHGGARRVRLGRAVFETEPRRGWRGMIAGTVKVQNATRHASPRAWAVLLAAFSGRRAIEFEVTAKGEKPTLARYYVDGLHGTRMVDGQPGEIEFTLGAAGPESGR